MVMPKKTGQQSQQKLLWSTRPNIWRGAEITPLLPRTDNEPGAPDALMAANVWWRSHAWPAPYDRTSHTIRVGDARDLSGIADESIHLIVTSPPYFNLKEYASDAAGA